MFDKAFDASERRGTAEQAQARHETHRGFLPTRQLARDHACALAAQKPFVERHIELVAPKVLVLVGAAAAQGLLGTTEGITRLRGRWFQYRLGDSGQTIPAMPIFHPAYLLRQPAQKRETWRDLLKLSEVLS